MKKLSSPSIKWERKKIWIVGGSSGIGLSLSEMLLKRGATVAISARRRERLESIQEQFRERAVIATADVKSVSDLDLCFNKIKKTVGDLDIVIYLAANYVPMRSFDFNYNTAKDIVDVNFMGFINLFSLIIPYYIQQKGGTIAVVSSVAGYRGLPNSLVYGATKAALINLAETMYLDLKPKGIDVHLINPGFVKTALTDKNKFNMPMIIEPEEAAKSIIKGIEKGEFEIHFPKTFTLLMKFVRLLPYKLYFYLIKKLEKQKN